MIDRLKDTRSIKVSGHRGYKSAYPENTLLAFHEALKAGVDMLEFDLRLSKDGAVVVIHDDTVDRTTNGTGNVREMTTAQLQELDAGGWFNTIFSGLKIPTFAELCRLLQHYPDVLLNVEIKRSPDAVQTVDGAMELLNEYGLLPRCVFTCFDGEIIAYLHDHYGAKTQGFMEDVMSGFTAGEGGTYSKMWAIGIEMKLLTPADVERFRDMGLQVWSYCPDTEQQVLYSIGCGATVMTCNDPMPALRLRTLLEG